jgi:hypothetical protein
MMPQQSQKKRSAAERVMEPWWAKIIIGAVMMVLAWSTYVDFSRLESGERKSLLIGQTTKFLYDIGGKWLPTSLAILAGLAFIAWGVVQVSKGKK